ncbi:MAG: type II toxin-antitoxin system RelE/ParE family toxin [Tannerellaceae bacterium]|nr:type II toxin-antitoxin system RelE/ParE family toxin [Tannerellaceae bacterium]
MFIQQLRSFANDQKKALYLQELYELGKTTDKKHRFQPEIVRKYQYCIRYLVGAGCIETLYSVNALNYEVLKGDKAGISSIRVSKQYRIEFTATSNGVEPIVTVCNILELSNHYK